MPDLYVSASTRVIMGIIGNYNDPVPGIRGAMESQLLPDSIIISVFAEINNRMV